MTVSFEWIHAAMSLVFTVMWTWASMIVVRQH